MPGSVTNGLDASSVDGISDIAYDIPNILVDYHLMAGPVPMGFWRSVGASQNGFFSESFVDEMAAEMGVDAVEYRLRGLSDPRAIEVIRRAAQMIDWQTRPSPMPRPAGNSAR